MENRIDAKGSKDLWCNCLIVPRKTYIQKSFNPILPRPFILEFYLWGVIFAQRKFNLAFKINLNNHKKELEEKRKGIEYFLKMGSLKKMASDVSQMIIVLPSLTNLIDYSFTTF